MGVGRGGGSACHRKSLGNSPGRLNYQQVQARAMREHLHRRCVAGRVYSTPRAALELVSLDKGMEEPSTKRARLNADAARACDSHGALGPLGMDLDMEAAPDAHCFFQVIVVGASRKKTVHVDVGAGGRVAPTSLIVSFQPVLAGGARSNAAVVASQPAASCDADNPNFLLDAIGVADETLTFQEETFEWTGSRLAWTIPEMERDDSDNSEGQL